jgi:hypothetical protein
MTDHSERWSSPFTQVELRRLWTYSDGALTVKGYRLPGGTARAGSWVLVDQATGNVQGVVPPGEFSRRFRPVDLFADVPAFATYLGTITTADGTPLVDLVLDRNPFMLANGRRRVARPHALIVPRSHRDGWSSATAQELEACRTAMTLVAAWYRSMDGGHVVFCANDSAPNLDYLRDTEVADGTLADAGTDVAVTKNPRQEVQHAQPMWQSPRIPGRRCSTPICTPSMPNAAGPRTTSRRRLRGIPSSERATGRSVPPSAATPCRWNPTAEGSPPTSARRRSPGVVVTARTSWAWTAPSGSCLHWDHPWTSSTSASHGPMASRPNPTRTWAGPSTWCDPAWPRKSGSMRHNGLPLISGRVSRPSPSSTD